MLRYSRINAPVAPSLAAITCARRIDAEAKIARSDFCSQGNSSVKMRQNRFASALRYEGGAPTGPPPSGSARPRYRSGCFRSAPVSLALARGVLCLPMVDPRNSQLGMHEGTWATGLGNRPPDLRIPPPPATARDPRRAPFRCVHPAAMGGCNAWGYRGVCRYTVARVLDGRCDGCCDTVAQAVATPLRHGHFTTSKCFRIDAPRPCSAITTAPELSSVSIATDRARLPTPSTSGCFAKTVGA